jgi:glycosyltransferase involved in cell wall biosynthesis
MAVETEAPRLLADAIVPDAYLVSWGLRASAMARRIIRESSIECVITSGPPHSVHVVALLLGSRRPIWVADFRDAWRMDMLRPPWPTQFQNRLDAALERKVAAQADLAIGVTRPIAEDLRNRLAASSVHIPNGWDPHMEPEPMLVNPPALDAGHFNLVYTGHITDSRGQDPRPLFAALAILSEIDAARADRLRVVIAGRLSASEQALLRSLPRSSGVVHVGHLSREETVALQRRGDALLLITAPSSPSIATGKLFEYLQAGKPIIALASGNEAARIVGETGTGVCVAPGDPRAIAEALLMALDGRLAERYAPRGLDRYVYPAPAKKLAAEIERLASARNS